MLCEHIIFVAERITDILNLEKEKEVKNSVHNVRACILALQKELLRIVKYLRDDEASFDERHYPELSAIADSSDNLLDRVISNVDQTNNDVAGDIEDLVKRIHNSYQLLLSQPTYNFITKDNINNGGEQRIGPINVSIDGSSKPPKMRRVSRPNSYGHVQNCDIVGFDKEIETLLNHLTQDDEIHIVGIVGMGGSGKTTLARHIYHHSKIKTHFAQKVWICVSQSWEKTNILNVIWRQVSEEHKAATMDYDRVVDQLFQVLCSESYLVILDDIWSIDAWYDIFPALPRNSGSKVVVTTRIKAVPQCIDPNVLIVEPKPLNDDESNELFRRRTFANKNIPHMLLQLGLKMVKKCKGLPLAITALAGVLRMDKNQSKWERISKRLTHSILNMADASTQGVVKEVLALSYYELPHYLKPCVLYLRVFPEDCVIDAEQLIKLWTAECLIRTDEDEVSLAEEYLDEMIQRYIVEDVKTNYKGQVRRFRIHDLIRQMCVNIDQERSLFLRDFHRLAPSRSLYGDGQNNNFSCMTESHCIEYLKRILGPETTSHVRSVIFLNFVDLSIAELQHLFVKFRFLRVLIIRDIWTSKSKSVMPKEIGNLIHLRYLELTGDIQLPESIGNLGNLWTLDMRYLVWNRKAQKNLCKLKELRHLYLPFDSNTKRRGNEELELERLKKLKTLWNARGGEWMLSGMPNLSASLQELCVLDLNSQKQLEAVFTTPSITTNNLQTLELDWSCYSSSDYYSGGDGSDDDVDGDDNHDNSGGDDDNDDSGGGDDNDDIGGDDDSDANDVKLRDMNILSKCTSLNKLKLWGQILSTPIVFPPNLIKLEMEYTYLQEREVMNIISRSCPYLKILAFGDLAYTGTELVCNENSFPQLEKLKLEFQENLEWWTIERGAMPNLHHLTIRGCKWLDLNPEGWTIISKIPQLSYFNSYGHPTKFEEKLGVFRKDGLDPSQSSGASTLTSIS